MKEVIVITRVYPEGVDRVASHPLHSSYNNGRTFVIAARLPPFPHVKYLVAIMSHRKHGWPNIYFNTKTI